jgi:hypothetical protein
MWHRCHIAFLERWWRMEGGKGLAEGILRLGDVTLGKDEGLEAERDGNKRPKTAILCQKRMQGGCCSAQVAQPLF